VVRLRPLKLPHNPMRSYSVWLLSSLLGAVPLFAQDDPLAIPVAPPTGNQLLNLHGVPTKDRTRVQIAHWPISPGEAAVCMWKDDKLGAISFTIDDNCAPNVDWWLEQAAKHEVPLTWFLVTAGVGGRNKTFNGTWELWSKVRAAGHAIESHTVTHLSGARTPETWQGIEWEYAESKRQIESNLAGHRVGFLAYPGGGQAKFNDPNVAAGIFLAARGTRGTPNGPQGLNYLSLNAMTKSNLDGGQEWNNLNNLFDKSLYRGTHYGGWAILVYHYFRAPYEEPLEKLGFYAANKARLWAGTFGDVARYAQQRETATLTVKESTSSRIVLSLTDRMDDRFYDIPLTVKIRLPAAWRDVAAQQAAKRVPVRVVEHEGAIFALADIVPDRGDTTVVPLR
jgi:peptidoglycan/xylan/chitin deacetylase (PgdA/CDA1 family)